MADSMAATRLVWPEPISGVMFGCEWAVSVGHLTDTLLFGVNRGAEK